MASGFGPAVARRRAKYFVASERCSGAQAGEGCAPLRSALEVLGAVGFVDQGFLDWKLITIDVEDDIASLLNDVEDIEVDGEGRAEPSCTYRHRMCPREPRGQTSNALL